MKAKIIAEEFDCGCVMSNPELEDGHTLWRLCKDHGDLIFKLVTDSPLRRKLDKIKEEMIIKRVK